MGERLKIGRLEVDVIDFAGALDRILALARQPESAYVVTPNADHVVRGETDDNYVRICNGANLVCADGMPLVWASRFLEHRLPERISGADLLPALCAGAARLGLPVFFLGGAPKEADKAAALLQATYPGLLVAGTCCPPFGFELDDLESERIALLIKKSHARLIFVGVGSPKQELWIDRWRQKVGAGVFLGIGMAIAFAAGNRRRAPHLMQRTGTEWLFRLAQEPRRLTGRYLRDVGFFAIAWRHRKR